MNLSNITGILSFYQYIITTLELRNVNQNNLLYLSSPYLKNSHWIKYDKKQMVLADSLYFIYNNYENPINIEFNPLNEQEESCSHLLINDSIHQYLKYLIYNLFNKLITIKNGTPNYDAYKFEKNQIDILQNPTKNTIYKFNNLFNIVSATSFSKNIINFSIDFISSSNSAKVHFKYHLYDALCTIQNNTIFGIYLEDSEIILFKQIYENYIINIINNLFDKDIKIPENSSRYPRFYVLMMIRVILQEAFLKKYNMYGTLFIQKKLSENYEILSNLNKFIKTLPQISEQQQEFDRQSYKNELEIRKASEPDWLILKDHNMPTILSNQELEVANDKNMDTFTKLIETANQKYNRRVYNFLANEQVNLFIQHYNEMKNNQEWSEIFYWQRLVLNILNENGASLWFDSRIDKYCFRSKIGGNIIHENKEGISELLSRALKERITNFLNRFNSGFFANHAIEIVLVHKLNGIQSQKLKQSERASNVIKILLFENEIPTIDDDKFDVQSPMEFSKDYNHLFYTRNRFVPTKHLLKRFNNNNLTSNNATSFDNLFTLNEDSYLLETMEDASNCRRSSFIEDLIFYLVNEDIHSYYYVMNWLAYFFHSLQKSGTALVLLGDQEVTQNILWDKIIKEIFGLQYCITINDKECNTASYFDIAKDKLFFHISDITDAATKFDDETLYRLVKDLLVKKSIARLNEENEQEESIIHGQMIITAKNPSPYIKRTLSKCTIIRVNDMDTIIEKLGVPDELILEDKIEKDLENFTNVLQSFNSNYEFTKYAMDTKYRQEISSNKTSNINKEDIEKEIDDFIQAIKDKNIEYFEKVKEVEDGAIYERLKNAFNYEDGYFIGQDLLHYYNATHEQKFQNKKQLTDKLKEKDEMFAQEVKTLKILTAEKKEEILFQAPKTTKETDYKELYKINGYTIAKDITIPYGAIIISSQDNIKKYKHVNDNAIKIHKEYKKSKAKKV